MVSPILINELALFYHELLLIPAISNKEGGSLKAAYPVQPRREPPKGLSHPGRRASLSVFFHVELLAVLHSKRSRNWAPGPGRRERATNNPQSLESQWKYLWGGFQPLLARHYG